MIGNRIMLRAVEPEDADLLYRWENDPTIWPESHTLAPFSRFTIEQYALTADQDIYSAKQLRLMISLIGEDALPSETIGAVDLYDFDPFHSRAGIGILIAEPYRKQGFALQALQLIVDYAFTTLQLFQVYANISADNQASIALYEKAGFESCGRKKLWNKKGQEHIDELILQLINPNCQESA